ncbi:MAG: 1,4-dihydroxy-6-naphthoate synthase [Bacteroidetes bacterium]|nr:MAG: 1,4-dihydroxy-6-naphthoate synthase [Bacteroidota bacterium]
MFSLAFSPCPNDTFIFYGLVHDRVDLERLQFDYRMADVEELNRWALEERTDLIKVSFHAWLSLRERYRLLTSGCAMGFGNGPLVVARYRIPDTGYRCFAPLAVTMMPDYRIALPGEHTTAHLLFSMAFPEARNKVFMRFSEIEDAVLSGEVDAGVLIHENRFTYEAKGLEKILDLGEYWESMTAGPIPLGGIVARESLGEEVLGKLNRIMKRSVQFAMDHPAETMGFVREHAQELDEEVMKKHIALYVNRFTLDPGEEGRRAIQTLIDLFNN